MSKGDTTVHVDFEVGGASAAKMTVMDIYRAQQANASKVNDAARALAKEQNITFSDAKKALREWVRMQAQAANEAATAQKKAEGKSTAEEAARERARLSLAAQKSKALEAQFMETERRRKRAAEEAIRDAKRVAREEIREAKMVAREKARDMAAGGGGIGGRLLGRGMWGAAMGIAGYAGVAGVSSIISSIAQGIQEIVNKRSELEKAITPIVMLEDNVSRMGSIRQEVVQTSVALGRSYEEVGQFYSDLVGSTGNLSESQRSQLIKETKELSALTGGSLVTAQNLLTKSYQIYGKELENVNQLQNKLMLTQDEGSITFDDMALRIPELLQTGKFAGMSIDDVLGTVIGATRRSGSIEKTMTGMRNFFLIMEEAQKKGITLTGGYTQKLSQLADMFESNAPKMQELFGKEVVVHAASVTDALGEITGAIQTLGSVTGETDAVADKLMKKFSDPSFALSERMALYARAAENAPNSDPSLQGKTLVGLAERAAAGKAQFAEKTGGTWGGLGGFLGAVGGILSPSIAQEGRDIALSKADLPQFIAEKRVDFFRKKESELADIQRSIDFAGGDQFIRPEVISRRDELMSSQLSPHLMTEEERRIFRETGSAPKSAAITSATSLGASGTGDTTTHALLREQNALLSSAIGGKSNQVTKPGGGRTNNEETL